MAKRDHQISLGLHRISALCVIFCFHIRPSDGFTSHMPCSHQRMVGKLMHDKSINKPSFRCSFIGKNVDSVSCHGRALGRRGSSGHAVINLVSGIVDSSDQFAALALPLQPDPSLSPENVVLSLVRGLRWNDVPRKNVGLERCYNFADNMCRAAVGGTSSGAAGVSLESFIKYASNPVFSKMVNCAGFESEPVNVIAGSETRGAMATQVVTIITPAGQRMPFLWTLQQERRPPLAGCWLVRQCLYIENAIYETI